jgi:Zn finger protein HypA/HybF involved in hydrogenase expression
MKVPTQKPDNQVGGTHYSDLAIEPIQFIEANGLNYCEGNAVKYISRWRNKNGIEDLRKAAWYIGRLIQVEETALEAAQELISTEALAELACEHSAPLVRFKMSETACEDCGERDEVYDGDINDLAWFGFYDMSNEVQEHLRVCAAIDGVTVLALLETLSQSASE